MLRIFLAAWSVLVPDGPALLSGWRMGVVLSILAYKALGNSDACVTLCAGYRRFFFTREWIGNAALRAYGGCGVLNRLTPTEREHSWGAPEREAARARPYTAIRRRPPSEWIHAVPLDKLATMYLSTKIAAG